MGSEYWLYLESANAKEDYTARNDFQWYYFIISREIGSVTYLQGESGFDISDASAWTSTRLYRVLMAVKV